MARARTVTATLASIIIASLTALDAASQPSPSSAAVRSATAVTYEARRTTKLDLVGTPLLPRARGEVEVKTADSGPALLKVKVVDLSAASQFGPEYLTFVLWAIPPQGRANNLGELRAGKGEVEIQASTELPTFALIVTAEPYFAVTTPSDTVVIENAIRADTRGKTSIAGLKYEIVPRGGYVAATGYTAARTGKREPPDVQQARNAVAIATIAQARTFAESELATAQRLLTQVEKLVAARGSERELISQSRAAVQAAEEARLQSTIRRAAAEAATERADAAAKEQAARAAAESEAAARRQAEADRERAEAERQQAEAARQQAQDERQRAEQEAQAATRDKDRAEQAAREATQARDEAEAARARAEQDKAALRATLLKQFNDLLQTRDTARGLIVSVGDVLFATGRYELQPAAREKLARFAGIVMAHPGLRVRAEGFTDTTGTDAINLELSQQRAHTVGQFLIEQGLPSDRITTHGLGAANPIAANDTAEGRQQNRRVELVVSGEVIGTAIGGRR